MATNTGPDAALQLSSSTPDTSSYLTYFTLAPDIAGVIWRYIRFQYPCITISELETKERSVDAVWENVLKYYLGSSGTYEDMAQRRSDLKMNGSEIRTRSLEMASSAWSVCVGFHPAIISDIVAWHREADQFERELLLITEAGVRERLRGQQKRDAASSSNSQQDMAQSVSLPPPALTRQNRRYTEGVLLTVAPIQDLCLHMFCLCKVFFRVDTAITLLIATRACFPVFKL
ncbi:40S ribosomal protein S6 [Paramarasmius palmivorus]|uniref:40S ribosomal protein S6 n=1 Tax=Paramarasmius palmivorus TaxID=297713 RepID=A0AAW0CR39_9AGAR